MMLRYSTICSQMRDGLGKMNSEMARPRQMASHSTSRATSSTQGARWWEIVLLLVATFALFRPDWFMDKLYEPYQEAPASEIFKVAGELGENDRLVLVIKGQDIEGEDKRKTVAVQLGEPGDGRKRLTDAGSFMSDIDKASPELQDLVAQADTGARKAGGLGGTVLFIGALVWALFQVWYASPLPFSLGIGLLNDTEARALHRQPVAPRPVCAPADGRDPRVALLRVPRPATRRDGRAVRALGLAVRLVLDRQVHARVRVPQRHFRRVQRLAAAPQGLLRRRRIAACPGPAEAAHAHAVQRMLACHA